MLAQYVSSEIRVVDGETFEQWLYIKGKSPLSFRNYACDIDNLIRWYLETIGPYSPENLTTYDIQQYRHFTLHIKGLMPATWNRRKASISLYIKYLTAHGIPSTVAMNDVDRAVETERSPRWLTAQEWGRLARWMERAETMANTNKRREMARRDAAMIALMAYAGLREFEVLKLVLKNVRLGERSGKLTFYGKREKYAEVEVVKELRKYLAAYIEDLPESGPDTVLFPITTRALQKRIGEIGRICQIEDFKPHRLRHVFCKRLQAAHVPEATAMMASRHANPETLRRYQMPGQDEIRAAMEAASMASLPKER